jgi:hypothetical protein
LVRYFFGAGGGVGRELPDPGGGLPTLIAVLHKRQDTTLFNS